MAQLRDSGTGRFTKAPEASGANDAALKAMMKASKALVGFTKTAATKVAPVGRAAIGAAGFVGSTGLRGAKGVGGIVNTRRKEAGFTQAGINDKLLGNHPILHAIAGGGMDIMNLAGRGAKGGLKGIGKGIGSMIKKKKPDSPDSADPKKEKPKSTENQREDRALIEKISDNVEKIAALEGGEGKGGAKPKAPAKAGGILGMIMGLGGMLAMGKGGILGKVFGVIGGIFKKLGGIAKAIPGMISKAMPFLKKGAKFFKQIFKKLFWPVTAILGIFSFVEGFIAGYKEGGLVEGFKQGIEGLFTNLVDMPLNMLKDAVAWIAGALGFENIEESLNSFDFNIGEMLADGFEIVIDFFKDIPDMMTDFVIWLAGGLGDWAGGKVLSAMGIDVEEHEKKKAAKQAVRAERDKKTDARRAAAKAEPEGAGAEGAEAGDLGGAKRVNTLAPVLDEEGLGDAHVAEGGVQPDGSYIDPKTGRKYKNQKIARKLIKSSRRKSKRKAQADQISAAGGKTGTFEQGKLVEVDGKPYTAPTPIAPAAGTDARAGAATSIQNAGIASGGGGGPIVIPAPAGGGGGGGGGGNKPVPIPMPLEIKTDPTLAIPAQ